MMGNVIPIIPPAIILQFSIEHCLSNFVSHQRSILSASGLWINGPKPASTAANAIGTIDIILFPFLPSMLS